MKRRVGLLAAVVGGAIALATQAGAQPGRFGRPPPPRPPPERASSAPVVATPLGSSRVLRDHVGIDMAARLMRSSDPDERLRGLARAASIRSPQATALLVSALDTSPAPGPARLDPRALVEVARGLARATDQPTARSALLSIVGTPTPARTSARPEQDDPDGPARVELAREIAALALAQCGEPNAAEQLIPLARGAGPGQTAASKALVAFPPQSPGPAAGAATPQALRFAAALGDLRNVEIVRAALRSSDAQVRAAALVAAGELGDTRALDAARAASTDGDARVRAAAATAMVLLDAPDAARVVESLLSDDATALTGARLAERAQDERVAKALAARAIATASEPVRTASIAALGRGTSADAVRALAALLATPATRGEAADALARSPGGGAMAALEAAAMQPETVRLAVRAYIVRALVRRERSRALDGAIARLERSDGAARALAAFARVALREARAADFLADRDPRVRRAAAMASLADPGPETARALLARRATEPDDATRIVLSIGLVGGDPDGAVATSALVDRARSGEPDAALAATVLGRRAGDARDAPVDALLASQDPILRAAVARGLGASTAADASGRLSEAWPYEANASVRRAIVSALAARTIDAQAPSRRTTLATAAYVDPDARVRQSASRAIAGRAPEPGLEPLADVAWLRVATADGAAPTGAPYLAAVVGSDGVALPIAFDDDGYALVPGVPPGEARVVLAPRVGSYEPPPR